MFRKLKLYQERDFGDLINATFLFLRQNFKPLFAAHLRINGPLLLLLVVLVIGVQVLVGYDFRATFGTTNMEWYTRTGDFWISTAIAGIGNVVFFISLSLVTAAYVKLYQQLEDGSVETISAAAVWEEMKGRIGSATSAVLLYFLSVSVGAMLCGIPGIFVLAAFWLYMPSIFFDGVSGYGALQRSYDLVKENWWFTFGLLLVISILAGILGLIINLPMIILTAVTAFMSTSDGSEVAEFSAVFYLWSSVMATILGHLSSMVSYTIVGITAFLHYGNLVEAKEGRGLVSDIDNTLNTPTTPEY